jgi:hypothetical protein
MSHGVISPVSHVTPRFKRNWIKKPKIIKGKMQAVGRKRTERRLTGKEERPRRIINRTSGTRQVAS